MPGLARLPRLEVAGGVDAASGQRREEPGRRVDDLDRDVVAGDQSQPSRSVMLSRTARLSRVVRIDSVICSSSRWPATWRSSAARLLAQAFGRVGVGHRLRREARVDDEQPQVVVAELVEAELREHEDAEDPILEDHRGEEHRLVEVVLGPRDRVGPRIAGGVAQVLGDRVFARPSR